MRKGDYLSIIIILAIIIQWLLLFIPVGYESTCTTENSSIMVRRYCHNGETNEVYWSESNCVEHPVYLICNTWKIGDFHE